MAAAFRFDRFQLDPADRRLLDGDTAIDLNARYLDALTLLVCDAGKLVSKDRFLDEVWRGVPVTDEALTQCIKTLRRALGDDASRPRFIETVPKHGYRFIALVESADQMTLVEPAQRSHASGTPAMPHDVANAVRTIIAGTIGAGVAGLLGGLIYGSIASSQPAAGVGGASILLVLLAMTIVVALLGGLGVSTGIAFAAYWSRQRWRWAPLGAGLGGLAVGAFVKLLGVDAFNLLLGASPGNITGAFEGALIGFSVGTAGWLSQRFPGLRRGTALAAANGAMSGALVALTNGHLMAGSLDLLARQFPESRLHLDAIGQLFGEQDLGRYAQLTTAILEGTLFAACVIFAMLTAERGRGATD